MYQVLINGKNVLIELNGARTKCGFYTTRFIDVSDVSLVESEAISNLRQDTLLQNLVNNEVDDPPLLFVEKIEHLQGDFTEKQNQGFTWYTE